MDPYSQNAAPAGPQPGNPFDGRTGPYKFNADEVRAFKECNRESFYQRSLPIGTFLGLGTFYAVKAGFLKPSLKWGPAPKVGLAVIFGYFAGKVSYQQKCAEKLMKLPNSPLAEALRKKKQQLGDSPFSIDTGIGMASAAVPAAASGLVTDSFQVYSDTGPRNTTELDFSKPLQSLDISDARPSNDSYHMEEPLPAATKNTTYEDLRSQNRDDYDKKRLQPNNRGNLQPDPVGPVVSRSPVSSPIGEQTNQYGDTYMR